MSLQYMFLGPLLGSLWALQGAPEAFLGAPGWSLVLASGIPYAELPCNVAPLQASSPWLLSWAPPLGSSPGLLSWAPLLGS